MLINKNKEPKKNCNHQNNLITLIGMMGTGKTKFGYLVAKKLNFNFYDTDAIIEKKNQLAHKKFIHNAWRIVF